MKNLTDTQAKAILQVLIDNAEPFVFKTHSKCQFVADFGIDGVIITPIGEAQVVPKQMEKLIAKGRVNHYALIKPTLKKPLLILPTWDKNRY